MKPCCTPEVSSSIASAAKGSATRTQGGGKIEVSFQGVVGAAAEHRPQKAFIICWPRQTKKQVTQRGSAALPKYPEITESVYPCSLMMVNRQKSPTISPSHQPTAKALPFLAHLSLSLAHPLFRSLSIYIHLPHSLPLSRSRSLSLSISLHLSLYLSLSLSLSIYIDIYIPIHLTKILKSPKKDIYTHTFRL